MPRWELDPNRLPKWLGPLRSLARKELHLWVDGWIQDRLEKLRWPKARGTRHLLLSICDHYEPLHGHVSRDVGVLRVKVWHEQYPKMADRFRDSTGRPPRHSFFFPGEEYDPRFFEYLTDLTRRGYGDIEVHLHHDGDTRASVKEKFEQTLTDLGQWDSLPKYKDGRHAWAFIHGNWSLANGRRDGRWCGVDDEVELLHELGCYADMTFPSAPDPCQPRLVNRIYYPTDARSRRCYETGQEVTVGAHRQEKVLFIPGPLALSIRPNRLAFRIDSAALDHGDPPSVSRAKTWAAQDVSVKGRPEWVFVKLHSHGAPEKNAKVMLGDAAMQFHQGLAREFNDGKQWKLHYVTARETYNVIRAAMDGKEGDPSHYYDYEIPPAPCARA